MIAFFMQLYPSLPLWNVEVLNQVASTIRCYHRAPTSQQHWMSRYSHIPALLLSRMRKSFQYAGLQAKEIIGTRRRNVPF